MYESAVPSFEAANAKQPLTGGCKLRLCLCNVPVAPPIIYVQQGIGIVR